MKVNRFPSLPFILTQDKLFIIIVNLLIRLKYIVNKTKQKVWF